MQINVINMRLHFAFLCCGKTAAEPLTVQNGEAAEEEA